MMRKFLLTHRWAMRLFVLGWLVVSPIHILGAMILTGITEVWPEVPSVYRSAIRVLKTGEQD